MTPLQKTERIMLVIFLMVFITLACLYAIEGNGQKKIIQMQQIIEISGASSDSEVEQIGELFGVKPTLEREYTFGEVFKIGWHDDPSPIELATVISEIKTPAK